jgi:hypothetical protein
MRKLVAAAVVLSLLAGPALGDGGCDSSVQQAQDQARRSYIQSRASMADSLFSRRGSSFKDMSCMEKLFSLGNQNLDIFFQPPSMQSLLQSVMTMACQAGSQYINQALGSFTGQLGSSSSGIGSLLSGGSLSGLTGGALNLRFGTGPGDGGLNAVNMLQYTGAGATSSGSTTGGYRDLLK